MAKQVQAGPSPVTSNRSGCLAIASWWPLHCMGNPRSIFGVTGQSNWENVCPHTSCPTGSSAGDPSRQVTLLYLFFHMKQAKSLPTCPFVLQRGKPSETANPADGTKRGLLLSSETLRAGAGCCPGASPLLCTQEIILVSCLPL